MWICNNKRTAIARYGDALSSVRADDMAAHVSRAVCAELPNKSLGEIDNVILGCANQVGEDNRNVVRMAALGARAIKADGANIIIAGGVKSMSRAPFVLSKSSKPFDRAATLEDTTIGWRFINDKMRALYGVDSMPETAENVAVDYEVSREDQDLFAYNSQQKYEAARKAGIFDPEIVPVDIPQRRGESIIFQYDEHPRAETTLDKLSSLRPVVRRDGTVTAGNASGVNDSACAMVLASDEARSRYALAPFARIVTTVSTGVAPRVMGIGPAAAIQKLIARTGVTLSQIDLFEINEAFASQVLASTRLLGLADDDERINPNGGAIAVGHPLGMSGARLVAHAARELKRRHLEYAICSMCVGVGQGVAMLIENDPRA